MPGRRGKGRRISIPTEDIQLDNSKGRQNKYLIHFFRMKVVMKRACTEPKSYVCRCSIRVVWSHFISAATLEHVCSALYVVRATLSKFGLLVGTIKCTTQNETRGKGTFNEVYNLTLYSFLHRVQSEHTDSNMVSVEWNSQHGQGRRCRYHIHLQNELVMLCISP